MSEKLQQIFADYWEQLINALPQILSAIILLAVFILLGWLLQRLVVKRLTKRWKETILSTFFANTVRWLFFLLGLIAALDVLGFGGIVSSLIAGAGVSAIIIGFAFKDIAENFLAGVLLAISRPFRIGNIIEVESHKGTVRGMTLRMTHLRNVEGKDIYIPNAMIVKNVVTNYTKDGLLRQTFPLGLDVSTDVRAAKKLILDYLDQRQEILKQPEPNVLTSDIGEFTVDLQVLFWVDVLKLKGQSPSYLGYTIRSEIVADVKDLLLRNGFNMPSQVLEHKMYQADAPLRVSLGDGG